MSAAKPSTDILAILQNQWFRDGGRAREIMARHADDPRTRAKLAGFYLFRGCHTGNVLNSVFGAKRCASIVWENASPQIGEHPSDVFPPDVEYLTKLLNYFRPKVVLAFGKVAEKGLQDAFTGPLLHAAHRDGIPLPKLIVGPHPAYRGPKDRLLSMRDELAALGL